MTRPRTIVAGSGLALAAIVMGEGNGTAADAFAAIEITSAVVIVLAVLGLLAALVIRSRRAGLTYREPRAIARTRVRAEITVHRPAVGEPRHLGDAGERLALPPADVDRASAGH